MSASWLERVAWQREFVSAEYRFRWGRLGPEYVGEWPDLLVVRADAKGRVLAVDPAPGAPQAWIDKLVRGEAAAFARAVSGRVSLHAAAAEVGGQAVVLVGASGAGKSTVVAELCDAYEGALLADDVAGIDTRQGRLRVEPGERAVWLAGASSEKSPSPRRTAPAAVEIGSLVFLAFDESAREPVLRPMRGARALEALLASILRFEPAAETWAREFDALGQLTESVPMWELVRSRLAELPRVTECAVRSLHRKTIANDR